MSDRPKWMPSDEVLTSMEYHAEEALRLGSHCNTHDAMRAFAYRTGLRAQIAVLEEMVPLVCPDCAAGAEDDGSFNHWQGRQVSEDDWEREQFECRASVIREKIAALRKEIGE